MSDQALYPTEDTAPAIDGVAVRDYIAASRSDNTKRAYAFDWKDFAA